MLTKTTATTATPNATEILEKTQTYVKDLLSGEGTGHDWWHILRVTKLAKYIAKQEAANLLIVELTALLHDIADWKFHDGDIEKGPRVARQWLEGLSLDVKSIDAICENIANISFKGAKVKAKPLSLEGQIVQDADRLDALGAIGIARAFAYGGFKQRPLYEPDIKPVLHTSFESYKNNQGTTVNHFYEKLLLLKDALNTKTAQKIAAKRHEFMENFLAQFFSEWEVKLAD